MVIQQNDVYDHYIEFLYLFNQVQTIHVKSYSLSFGINDLKLHHHVDKMLHYYLSNHSQFHLHF